VVLSYASSRFVRFGQEAIEIAFIAEIEIYRITIRRLTFLQSK